VDEVRARGDQEMTRTRRTFFSMSLSFQAGAGFPSASIHDGTQARPTSRTAMLAFFGRTVMVSSVSLAGSIRLCKTAVSSLSCDSRSAICLRTASTVSRARATSPASLSVRLAPRAAVAAAAERRGLQYLPPHEGVEQRGSDRDGGLDLLLIGLLGLARLGSLRAPQTLAERASRGAYLPRSASVARSRSSRAATRSRARKSRSDSPAPEVSPRLGLL